MPYSDYKKQRIIHWYARGLRAPTIRKRLDDGGLSATSRNLEEIQRNRDDCEAARVGKAV